VTNTRQSTDYVFEGKVNVLKSTNKEHFSCLLSKLPVAAQMTKGPGVFRLSYIHSLKLVRLRSTKTDRPTDWPSRCSWTLFSPTRRPRHSFISLGKDTHDGWYRHINQPRRRPCCHIRAQQAVAAVAVEDRTSLELRTRVPQHLEASRHHAPPLDQVLEEMRPELCVEGTIYPNRMPSTSHLREEDAAHWRAAVKLKAVGSNDSTRYVYPKHVLADGVHRSDFVPFSLIARNPPQA
jgi:hypothetical protein